MNNPTPGGGKSRNVNCLFGSLGNDTRGSSGGGMERGGQQVRGDRSTSALKEKRGGRDQRHIRHGDMFARG